MAGGSSGSGVMSLMAGSPRAAKAPPGTPPTTTRPRKRARPPGRSPGERDSDRRRGAVFDDRHARALRARARGPEPDRAEHDGDQAREETGEEGAESDERRDGLDL